MPSRSLLAGLLFAVACSSGHQLNQPTSGTVPMPAFAATAQIATDQVQAPWSLTATDGSGLQLTKVDAKAVFEGPLAFTELHLYFHNTEDRVREGTFAITLPSRAAVSRFAMENDGQWMEAELVEKLRARRAYEDFLHRKQDPALLEKADGNQFTARVFPIPARGDKHIVISFSQELPGERYVLPLRGLPQVEKVDVRMSLLGSDGHKTEQLLSERNWQPDRDFVSTAPVTAEAVGAGPIVAAQLAVLDQGAAIAADAPTSMTILVDTSASRTLGFAAAADRLDRMIGELRKKHGDGMQLQVVAFDQETQLLFSGAAKDWTAKHKQTLLERGAAGASDLGQAIGYLSKHTPNSRLVLFGDGVITAGAKADEVAAAIKQLKIDRFDVVLSGGIRDEQLAGQLVRAATRAGAVLDLDTGVDGVVAALGERMLTDVAIDVKGASWVYPRVIPAARVGSRVMVYARMPASPQTIEVAVGTHRQTVGVVAGTGPLVQRATAAAQIAELETQLALAPTDKVPALKAEIAKRSIAARVVSSQTSLLVLETETDYQRFGIDRTALADIMEIGPNGIVMRNHTRPVQQIAEPDRVGRTKRVVQEAPKAELKQKQRELDGKELEVDAEIGGDDGADFKKSDDARGGASMGSAAGPRSPAADAPAPPPPPPPTMRPPAQPSRVAPAPREEAPRQRRRAVDRNVRDDDAEIAGDADDGVDERAEAWPPKDKPAPLQGELAEIAKSIGKRDTTGALARAKAWHDREPGNVLAWIGMGEALEARKDLVQAARAYGSIIDLFPGRADLRRFAGERLERIGAQSRELAIDTYRRAVADRPDHMTGHRLLAYALLRAGHHDEAFKAILAGVEQKYPDGRFAGGDRILKEDAGLIGAAYAAAVPGKRTEIAAELKKRGLAIADGASTRFILYWETDANDVDFHIQDARGGHAFYSSKKLPSGGELYADVTTGYGPECFAIPGTPKAGPYRLSIDYYSQGPMGYGMGVLQIVQHDGKGKLTFQDRPYVIMADHAYVDLGKF